MRQAFARYPSAKYDFSKLSLSGIIYYIVRKNIN
ncbi:MAG: hypothetical protein HPY66_3010 [Firmicutes bacterium]|nr:hypothetical protein [Bacillota bacterium]